MMKPEMPSRRVVLQGALALALGCGLCLPMLSGCDSKQSASTGAAAPASPEATPAANKKMAQADVQYQAQPKGEQKCGGCQYFIAASNTCMLVEGQISAEGWCSLWAQKA